MKIIFKLIGIIFVFTGCCINVLGVLSSLQGRDSVGAVIGGGIFIALGITVIVINKKGYSW